MTPEDFARQNIDQQLKRCGRILPNMSDMNITAGQGELASGKFNVTPYQITDSQLD